MRDCGKSFGTTTLTPAENFDVLVARLDSAGKVKWAKVVDHVRAVAVDGSGNPHLAGFFCGTATFGTKTLTATGTIHDIFVVKLVGAGKVNPSVA